jgi:TetR/AcrR family transcriptional regulator
MARTRATTYDDQRSLILARAAELFAERGYSAATMNDVAAACGMSKATLYHYFRDKQALLANITLSHVQRLEALVAEVRAQRLSPADELRTLIERFMAAYADARHEHRVLTEDVKFLPPSQCKEVQAAQRRIVAVFAHTIAKVRPDVAVQATPLAMLLFGMINWTFTWLKPDGAMTHAELAPMVVQLFGGGLPAVNAASTKRRSRAAALA